MRKYSTILIIFFLSGFLSAQTKYSQIRVHLAKTDMVTLAKLGIAVDDGSYKKEGYWETILSSTDLDKVQKAGFAIDILTDDYCKTISDGNKALIPEVERINREIRSRRLKSTTISDYPVPVNFKLGSMGGFLTLQEVMDQLDSMAQKYPDLITQRAPASTTVTVEGRSLYFVKISKNPNTSESEPKVFYNGLIHAREPEGMQQLIFYMWYLLENYNTNDEVKYLLDHLELYFIPVINPDGYEYNHTSTPGGGGQWRKNRRNNGNGSYGVDLNRNFGYQWGYDNVGSSPTPADETYRGTAPFSEPETQIVRDFCVQHLFSEALNYHTYSDLFLYPWSYITQDSPDSAYFVNYAGIMTRQNRYLTGVPGAVLYNTNGDSNDWMYGDQTLKTKVFAYTPETGTDQDNFWPFPDRIIPLCQENMYQNLMMAHLALRYAETRDLSPTIQPQRMGYFKYEFRKYGLAGGNTFNVSIQPLDTTQIIHTGAAKAYTNPALFLKINDSIPFVLSPTMDIGTKFQYVIKCDNGWYTFRDTITKYFGPPMVVFTDSCNSFVNWTSPKWNVTYAQYYSPEGSITDSPSGNYASNANVSVVMNGSVDLKDSPVAVVNFMTRWITETTYDYVQFKGSMDTGTTFVPLKGRYTVNGSHNEDPGKPVYDGMNTSWVKEEVMLENTQNRRLIPEFTLVSDPGTNYDGFYFDNFSVTIIDMSTSGIGNKTGNDDFVFTLFPNPANDAVTLRFHNKETDAVLELYSANGVLVKTHRLSGSNGEYRFSVAELAEGVYFYRLRGKSGPSDMKKITVIR